VTGCANDPRHGAAEPGAALCRSCLDGASRDIGALTWDYARLESLLPSPARALRAPITGRREAPCPVDLGVDALQRAIHGTLTAWEPAVREAAGLPPERASGVRHGWAVAAAVDVMAPRTALISSLAAQWGFFDSPEGDPVFRDGCDALRTLRRLHWRAGSLLGGGRLVHRLPGECSGCGAGALRRADGSETVWCGICQRRWTWDDYRRYVSLILDTLDDRTKLTDVDTPHRG
jgi:hypothetical protein